MGDPASASTLRFLATLRARVPSLERAPRLSVAYSGGMDSAVLLTALVELSLPVRIRAVHIDHGLHADSASWQARCRDRAAQLGIAFEARRVTVERAGAGVEAAARQARYGALEDMLADDEILMTAHHADDQLETVLLRLLRGTGVRGLRAIAELAPLGRGVLSRPLLAFTRAEIASQAERWRLDWLEDPANESLEFDRNYLRCEILPRLRRRWPAAARAAVRLAQHMRDADEILTAMAELDLQPVGLGPLPRAILRGVSAARQRNLLRALVMRHALPMPDAAQLDELRAGLAVTRPDAETCVRWPGAEARVFRDRLYLGRPLETFRVPDDSRLRIDRPWRSEVLGTLSLVPVDGPGLPDAWVRAGLDVRFRQGGESFQPLERAHARPLKRWLQEADIVPWMRDRIPLLYRGDQLVAVGDLWIADAARSEAAPYWVVHWHGRPMIH